MSALKPKIKQDDLFLCDLSDAPLKDDFASMEHPVFTISKKPDMAQRHYEHNGNTLDIYPSSWGIATMYDKDILIYATSKLMQAQNRGEKIDRNIVFEAQEALRFMHRTDRNGVAGGTQFRALELSLRRLKGTMLETNITTNDVTQTKMFGLVDSVTIYREHRDGRVLEWGIELSQWLYNAILGNEVLTLHKDYFRLRTPTEKRVYELARRHCGSQDHCRIGLDTLLKKVGSSMLERRFRFAIRKMVETDHLPDYHIALDSQDNITFTRKKMSGVGALSTNRSPGAGKLFTVDNLDRFLDSGAQKKCPEMARQKGIDYYFLKNEFVRFLNSKGAPENISASFISFIKQKKIV